MSIYFTVTGMVHYLGQSYVEPGAKVILEKEPDNDIDKEAIAVKMEGLGKIGYVASSYKTALTDDIDNREIIMKGIDYSYYYETEE